MRDLINLPIEDQDRIADLVQSDRDTLEVVAMAEEIAGFPQDSLREFVVIARKGYYDVAPADR